MFQHHEKETKYVIIMCQAILPFKWIPHDNMSITNLLNYS